MNPPKRPQLPSLSPLGSFRLHSLGGLDGPGPSSGEMNWLWRGILAPGQLTLLTSLWKSGKTTLLAVLLARMKDGGQLLGLPIRPAKALVLSEENLALWAMRRQRLDFGQHIGLISQPFATKPTHAEWRALIDHAGNILGADGGRLLVVDSKNLLVLLLTAVTCIGSVVYVAIDSKRLTKPGSRSSCKAVPRLANRSRYGWQGSRPARRSSGARWRDPIVLTSWWFWIMVTGHKFSQQLLSVPECAHLFRFPFERPLARPGSRAENPLSSGGAGHSLAERTVKVYSPSQKKLVVAMILYSPSFSGM
jgi:hypothetical protein